MSRDLKAFEGWRPDQDHSPRTALIGAALHKTTRIVDIVKLRDADGFASGEDVNATGQE
jgi:hypothetical protein